MISRDVSRSGAALVAVALSCTFATACGSGSGSDSKTTTITFESYNYGTPDLGGQGTQQLINEFEKAHPNIKIAPKGDSSADIYAHVQTEAAAGNAPDVAQIGWSKEAAAVSSLPVVPVQDIAPAKDFTAATSGIVPQAMAAGEVNNKIVAMPYTISTPTLFYNATIFHKAGLDPNEPPKTWADVKKDALAIKQKTSDQGFYSAIANSAKSDFLTQSVINSNGGSLLNGSGKPQLDSPAAVQALSTMQDLTKSGAQPNISDDDAVPLFQSGKLGMYVTSTALLAGFQKAAKGSFELKTAGLPQFGSQPAKPTYSGSGLFVLTKDKKQQAAAWQFIKFLTSARGFTIIAEKIGYLPLRPAIIHDSAYLSGYLKKNPQILPAIAQLNHVTPYQSLSGPHADQARQILQDNAVTPIVFNGAQAQKTCTQINKRIISLLPNS